MTKRLPAVVRLRSPQVPKLLISVAFFLLSILIAFSVSPSRADVLDDVTSDLARQQQQLADLEKRKAQLSKDISSASLSLSQVSIQLTAAEDELAAIESDLATKESELDQQEQVRDLLVRQLYIQSRISSFEVVLSSEDLGESARQLQYYNENINSLGGTITQLAEQVTLFQSNKAAAQKIRDDLAVLRAQYQSTVSSSQRRLSSTSSQLAQVKSTIKNLTSQQEQLLLAKFAATAGSETVGENPPLSESLPSPGFGPAYMVATYGFRHRIGMSQYGAYGRAKPEGGGQDYQTILKAYYGNLPIESYSTPSQIKVDGIGVISFEDNYLKGIAEMPSSWEMEALKAQAVAARTYALYRTSWKNYIGREGDYLAQKSICPTTSCQVYNWRKATPGYWEYDVSQRWRDAVDATRGIVIKEGGVPLHAFYHSTAGGYTISSLEWINYWDWNNGIRDFHSDGRAYEQISSAPWYHTGWGSRTGSGYNPWMTEEEFSDVFNAYLLSKQSDAQNRCRIDDDNYPYVNTGSYTPCLSQIDKDLNKDGVVDGRDRWDMAQVRDELARLGVPSVTSISAATVAYTGGPGEGANTSRVFITGSGGPREFVGRDFADIFNLRSRGTLQIPTYRFDIPPIQR